MILVNWIKRDSFCLRFQEGYQIWRHDNWRRLEDTTSKKHPRWAAIRIFISRNEVINSYKECFNLQSSLILFSIIPPVTICLSTGNIKNETQFFLFITINDFKERGGDKRNITGWVSCCCIRRKHIGKLSF